MQNFTLIQFRKFLMVTVEICPFSRVLKMIFLDSWARTGFTYRSYPHRQVERRLLQRWVFLSVFLLFGYDTEFQEWLILGMHFIDGQEVLRGTIARSRIILCVFSPWGSELLHGAWNKFLSAHHVFSAFIDDLKTLLLASFYTFRITFLLPLVQTTLTTEG